MSFQQFFIQLAIVTGLLFLLLFLLGAVFQQTVFDAFAVGSIVFFMQLCVFLFWRGKRAATDKNPNAFTQIALGAIGVKMFLAILIVAIYVKVMVPDSSFFVLVFLIIYFTYTIFETYFLTRLGRKLPSTTANKDGK